METYPLVKELKSHVSGSSYHFVGTGDGRILQYTHDKKTFLSRLYSFSYIHTNSKTIARKNAVASLDYFDGLLAASAYGGSITLINIYTRASKIQIKKSKSSISCLKFLDKERLISATSSGEIYIHFLSLGRDKKITTTLTDITNILYIESENMLLVCAKTNYLTLIDLNKELILAHSFIKISTIITSLSFSRGDLYIESKKSAPRVIKKEELHTMLLQAQEEHLQKAQSGYLTKRAPQKSIYESVSVNPKALQKLQEAYEANHFKECYEIVDSYALDSLELVEMLEKHWRRLIKESETFALKGQVKGILATLKELLFVESRQELIGDLLRLSFFVKISQLISQKHYNTAQNMIYSYIDIFAYDLEIAKSIQEFEFKSSLKIAIFRDESDRRSRGYWREYFHKSDQVV